MVSSKLMELAKIMAWFQKSYFRSQFEINEIGLLVKKNTCPK